MILGAKKTFVTEKTVANYHIDVINNAYPHLMNIEFFRFFQMKTTLATTCVSFQDGHVIKRGAKISQWQ